MYKERKLHSAWALQSWYTRASLMAYEEEGMFRRCEDFQSFRSIKRLEFTAYKIRVRICLSNYRSRNVWI